MATLARTSRDRPLRLSAVVLSCASVLVSCDGRARPFVYLVAGPTAADRAEFRPVSSYAEYLAVPGLRRELRVTLASYAASCDSFVAPSDKDASVTVTVLAPEGVELGPGSYAWAGHPAHGGTQEQPERAYALPTFRLGHHGAVLPVGGEIQLESIATTQEGRVRGLLAFEFAGDAEHPAASLKGHFEAKLCRVHL